MRTTIYSRLLPLFLSALAFHCMGQDSFTARLSGHGQPAPVLTAAYGEIEAEMIGDTLVVSGWFRNLSSNLAVNIAGGAHIHMAYAGRNGGVIYPLTVEVDASMRSGTFDPAENRFELSPEQQEALRERALYINVHSDNFGSGEIRGQLQPAADSYHSATLFGSYQLPMVMSPGSGALVLDLTEDTLTVSGTFNNLSSPLNTAAAGGMHLHNAPTGTNGGISIFLNVDADTSGLNGIIRADSNRYTLTAEQKAALQSRRLYANVHSMNFGGGELRGPIAGTPIAVFRGYLAGTNQVPFVTSRADGMVIAELGPDSSLTVSGTFAGIRSGVATQVAGGAHIHMALPGTNGGIQFFLNSDLNAENTGGEFAADSNQFVLDAMQLEALMNRAMYVNIHSNRINSGEIRGQLLPESQLVFNANLSSVMSLPPVKSLAGGLVKAELTGNQLTLSGSLSGLGSDVDTSIAGGAHVHLAPAGSTGGVVFPINLTFDGDLTRATLAARQNTFTLDEDTRRMITQRGAYINVHTLDYGSGEIRSNLLPESQAYFVASLAGSQQPAPVNSSGSGQAILELNRGGNIVVTGSFNDLSSKLATNVLGGVHIHAARSGMNGSVIEPLAATLSGDSLSGVFEPAKNRITFSEGMVDTLMAFGNYVNVHSSTNPGGEIRGQLLPIGNVHLSAQLRPMNAVQPIMASGASGAVTAVVSGSTLRLAGSFRDLTGDFNINIAGGAHVHGARAGGNGGILVGLRSVLDPDLRSGAFTADTTYQLTPEQAAAIVTGNSYVNIHTTTFGSGELRGQLLSAFNRFPEATSQITMPADGSLIVVRSTDTDPFEVEWTASEDADSLAYIIQVTADPTFTLIPLQLNTAGSRMLQGITLADIDTLLADIGILIGVPVPVYARVVASDGSLQSVGDTRSFTLRRDPVSSVPVLPDDWAFDVFPTIASDRVLVRVSAPTGDTGTLEAACVSLDGQILKVDRLGMGLDGEVNSTIDVSGLPNGMCLIALMDNGQVLASHKVVIQR